MLNDDLRYALQAQTRARADKAWGELCDQYPVIYLVDWYWDGDKAEREAYWNLLSLCRIDTGHDSYVPARVMKYIRAEVAQWSVYQRREFLTEHVGKRAKKLIP